MATGPWHYQRAEQLLATYHADNYEPDWMLAEAQVHATLALAAATGLAAGDPQAGLRTADAVEWERVASAAPPEDEQP